MVCLYFDGLDPCRHEPPRRRPRSIMAPEENLNGFKGEPLLLHCAATMSIRLAVPD
jgi:hypothetical protein